MSRDQLELDALIKYPQRYHHPDNLGSSAKLLHLNSYPELGAAAILVCQGEHGWDEYLLLRHFDPCQALDALA